VGKIDGKVAVITGGASGIGKATTKLFIEEGSRVVLGDIQDDLGKTLADELGPNAIYQHANVRSEDHIKSLIELAVEKFGKLDIIFNNAGFGGVGGPIDEIPTDAWDVTMEVMLRSVFLGIKHAVPIMKKQGYGSIVSTASVAGMRTGFGPHAYSTAKAGIIHLTHTAAMELGEFNIRVNCVAPGGIATAIFGRGFGFPQDKSELLSNMLKPTFLSQIQPIKRAGLPEDIAQAVLWLASDDSSFVSGHALLVDGGLLSRSIIERDMGEAEERFKALGIEDMEEHRRKLNEDIAKMKNQPIE
jgi:NAD(P)-dependent dehydrogenase (short-subunit alcohol dehydrogenase family)